MAKNDHRTQMVLYPEYGDCYWFHDKNYSRDGQVVDTKEKTFEELVKSFYSNGWKLNDLKGASVIFQSMESPLAEGLRERAIAELKQQRHNLITNLKGAEERVKALSGTSKKEDVAAANDAKARAEAELAVFNTLRVDSETDQVRVPQWWVITGHQRSRAFWEAAIRRQLSGSSSPDFSEVPKTMDPTLVGVDGNFTDIMPLYRAQIDENLGVDVGRTVPSSAQQVHSARYLFKIGATYKDFREAFGDTNGVKHWCVLRLSVLHPELKIWERIVAAESGRETVDGLPSIPYTKLRGDKLVSLRMRSDSDELSKKNDALRAKLQAQSESPEAIAAKLIQPATADEVEAEILSQIQKRAKAKPEKVESTMDEDLAKSLSQNNPNPIIQMAAKAILAGDKGKMDGLSSDELAAATNSLLVLFSKKDVPGLQQKTVEFLDRLAKADDPLAILESTSAPKKISASEAPVKETEPEPEPESKKGSKVKAGK